MSRRPVVALRPTPTTTEDLGAVLDRFEPLAAERLDIAVALAHARAVAAAVGCVTVGPAPTIAQVHAWRELRLSLGDLGRLVAPVDPGPEPGDDPELAVLVAAIRSTTTRHRTSTDDDDEHDDD